MKKVIVMLVGMLLMSVVGVFAQSDSTAVEPGGFGGFISKYWDTGMIILGALGVTGFATYRAGKIRDAFNEIVKAGEDKNITETEFQSILKALKAIWGKKYA